MWARAGPANPKSDSSKSCSGKGASSLACRTIRVLHMYGTGNLAFRQLDAPRGLTIDDFSSGPQLYRFIFYTDVALVNIVLFTL